MTPQLAAVLEELNAQALVKSEGESAVARWVATAPVKALRVKQPANLPRLGYVYELAGIENYWQWIAKRQPGVHRSVVDDFARAFACWSSVATLPGRKTWPDTATVSAEGLRVVEQELGSGPLGPMLQLALHMAVSGLLGERTSETRLELQRFSFGEGPPGEQWREHVFHHVVRAIFLLIRKANGWSDIQDALRSLDALRDSQAAHESGWIDSIPTPSGRTQSAVELVGLYHVAQIVTLAGRFVTAGKDGATRLYARIEQHRDRARAALNSVGNGEFLHVAELVSIAARELVRNSIWAQVEGLSDPVQNLAKTLAEKGAEKPLLELWPGQQAALRERLLDTYPRAILVEMPTSAGKTLLAKFVIVQTRALSESPIAYIVPTRALVNQVTFELRKDLNPLGLQVERAVPAYELDPSEERLLSDRSDVLVTTPEKLDLLVRKEHPSVQDLGLVVADEAHGLSDRMRGARLELLLGMVKRDRPGVRFLLLSPFVPESDDLLTWLGEDRTIPAIRVDWRPSRRIVGAVKPKGRNATRRIVLETLPAADNTDIRSGIELPLGPAVGVKRTLSGIVNATASNVSERGAVLILCRGPGTAITRAIELCNVVPQVSIDDDIARVSRFIHTESGSESSSLATCLQHGVAYHHAGLSQETRWLIEGLIRRQKVKIVCGTTTLAQGVNFPISTVIVEGLRKGDADLSYSDFWNIAGRAGRALMDSVGIVAFPAHTSRAKSDAIQFLEGEARAISSQLASLIDQVDLIGEQFDTKSVFRAPLLSPLLQFLAHAMRVSGTSDLAESISEVEELLRSSLVYHQVRQRGDDAVSVLVSLCRRYLAQLKDQRFDAGKLALADQTGFATPSVLTLLAKKGDDASLSDVGDWHPDRLFGADIEPLAKRVEAIAWLPEIHLGQDEHGPFSPERVASILRDWVRGVPLRDLTQSYAPPETGAVTDKDEADFSRYLFSRLLGRASWGIGALESVCLAGLGDDTWNELGHVPSMIYFGVKSREAVWMSMVGAPRFAAGGLGELWGAKRLAEPRNFKQLRDWIGSLDSDDWTQVLPPGAKVSPSDMKWLWGELSGQA